MKSLLILGRQPALGLAELESLYGADTVQAVGKGGALLDIEPSLVQFGRLGGSIKLAKIIQVHGTTDWHNIEPHLAAITKDIVVGLADGKIRLGISTYGIRVHPQDVNRTGLSLKKAIKNEGRSARIIPNKSPELNSAQVLHNQLTGPTGIELVIARDGDKVIIARTVAEQDIEAYAARDQNRPARDAKVGMLPPKLAQILINLATAGENPELEGMVLDPFCGTGVLLQEARIMGYDTFGSDIDSRMIGYSAENLLWLEDRLNPDRNYTPTSVKQLEIGDATTHRWQLQPTYIACETYLGKPLTSLPPRQVLDKIMAECDDIHEKFLRNIGSQIEPGTRLCLAVPAWHTKNGFLHLKTLAKLDELGYNRQKFVHAHNEELIYHRPGQIVARELVVLEKN